MAAANENEKLPETNPEVSTRNNFEIPKDVLQSITAQARIEQEQRYKVKLNNTKLAYEQELENLKNEITFERQVKPSIQAEYLKNGGKTEFFNDFFALNNGKFTDVEKIKDTILETKKATPWAFQEQTSVSAQVGKGLGNNGVIQTGERHYQTIYPKKATTK